MSNRQKESCRRNKSLSEKSLLEKDELKNIERDLDKIPDAVAPTIKERYYAALAVMPNTRKEFV